MECSILKDQIDLEHLSRTVQERRIQLVGHTLCMLKDWQPKIAASFIPPGGKRKHGRPWETWRQTLKENLKFINVSWDDAKDALNDQNCWKTHEAQCVLHRTC